MIHCYKLGGLNIVLDVYSGSVHLVDEVAYDIIGMYENKTNDEITAEILNKYGVASSSLLNSEKSMEVFEMFKYLYVNDLIPKETVTMTLQESLEKYMSGNVALIGAGANFLNMIS